MRVNVIVSGLCLFVPEDGATKRMHVLLPKTDGDMRHIPILAFDAVHLIGDNVSRNSPVVSLLREFTLTLGDGDIDLKVCLAIANLRDVATVTLDPELLGKDHEHDPNKQKLTSRVTFSGGAMESVARGACWTWKKKDGTDIVRPLAHRAQWSFVTTAAELTLTLNSFHGSGDSRQFTLEPFDDIALGEVINLQILHIPAVELPLEPVDPDEPKPDAEAPHFKMYHELLGVANGFVPRFRGKPGSCDPVEDGCSPELYGGGSPYTCMLGGVGP